MANVQVSPPGTLAQQPYVAVNWLSTNIILVGATDFTSGPPLVAVYRSMDSGNTWSPTTLPLPAGFLGGESNVVAYGYSSIFLVASHVFNAVSGTIVVYRSTDNGATFSAPIIVAPGYGTFTNNVQVIVEIDNAQASSFQGNSYLIYVHGFNTDVIGGSTIFFQRSLDGGVTWQQPVLVSPEAGIVTRSDIGIGLSGIVYVAYITLSPTTEFKVSRSLDGGTTFLPAVTVSSVTLVPDVLPVTGYGFLVLTSANIATDTSSFPTSGNVYVTWQDNRLGYAAIFLSKSVDDGVTWSAPLLISNSGPGFQNFFPAIAVSPKTGLITVIYYSNQADGFNLNTYVAESSNGGNSFTVTQLSTASSNPNAGSATPVTTIGYYIDIASSPPADFIGVWTDTRTGAQTIFSGT
ncbi:hypothetical protein GCM10008018_59390 [Paenibacillus marchantiophytorum]|uniref:exo-alpha-sialidase n=1 Tax=Paenibacillus marchantiophytorum TaxID=1619310 RepID=A0ABQ1FBY6_9BACL|nr:sialidase family protein [Paenibacillus marchantiophytorum]GGA05510.1 hypothetical protein GCM10008018_59390 [Paenibacillus marchantiophytorum]